MTIPFDRLTPDARLRLPGVDGIVTLKAVTLGPFCEFVYEGPSGLGKLTLAEDELEGLELLDDEQQLSFDADPVAFRLGIEAERLATAFEHNMSALAVSSIQPLPHQLEAVYDCFLPEPRLRYLLADDPGAGKTIMAGLYMKELMLRRVGDRILIVAPANLRPQWARELAERFQLDFVQLDSATFDAAPTQNAWDLYDRLIVSRDFLKQERVREAFSASERDWDLAVIDEAHGFTLSVDGKGLIKDRSERYKAAEEVARRAHRLILLTATPHSGRDASLWGLLRLCDLEAYGDRCPRKLEVPDRLYRKVSKEIMVDMAGNKLFKPRYPHTLDYELAGPELELYDAVTDFVSRQLSEIRGAGSRNAAGFALTTMQRRLASSVRAICKTLERRLGRIEQALADPEAYLRKRRAFQARVVPEGESFEDMDEQDRWKLEEQALEEWLPDTILELEAEAKALAPLLTMAQEVETRRSERKLNELLDVVRNEGLQEDRRKKLLVFTEHKDTLDYLVENLSSDYEVAVIHGGMKLGERIAQERFFRERAQIMVATEAAGEGINLQFCHLMVNYDIPWNPNRLEQRMGRIHRIGQVSDVHVFNLVAANTREGYVLRVLLRKMEAMGRALGDPVFDVIGETFAGYKLRELLESVIAGEVSREDAANRLGGEDVDPEIAARARRLLGKALARNHIDWEAEREHAARAEERRMPPNYLERFFLEGIAFLGGKAERRLDPGTLRVARTPDLLVAQSKAAGAVRTVAPSYERLTFDKAVLARPRTDREANLPEAEMCGPGHPLFDLLVAQLRRSTADAVQRGARFTDPGANAPYIVHYLLGDAVDGNHDIVRRTFTAVRSGAGQFTKADKPTLYDMAIPAPAPVPPASPSAAEITMWARGHVLEDEYRQARAEREAVASIQVDFLRRSFNALVAAVDEAILTAEDEVDKGVHGADGRLRKAELNKAGLEYRSHERLAAAERGKAVTRGPVRVLGSALLVPAQAGVGGADATAAPGERSDEIEEIAIGVARRHELARGATVDTVERDNIGFDLVSRRDAERRCIEVKGRSGIGLVELTWSEFAKAQELGEDYWLYVVLDCSTPAPRLYCVQNPARVLAPAWRPTLEVRYRVDPEPVIVAASEGTK